MNICEINKDRWDYKNLRDMSGVREGTIDNYVMAYQEQHGRMPKLREIPGADSEPYLRDRINVKDYGDFLSSTEEEIKKYTGQPDIPSSVAYINRTHDDLEVHMLPFQSFVMTTVIHRPTVFTKDVPDVDVEDDVSVPKNRVVFGHMMERLADLYGVDIQTISTKGIIDAGMDSSVINPGLTKAFILGGKIYVNSDVASTDSKVHELLHMFLGGIKYNPEYSNTYNDIISSAEQLPGYSDMAKNYPNRTRSDVDEEIAVTEYAKYLTGGQSLYDNLSPKDMEQLEYEMTNTADVLINGGYSARSLTRNISDMTINDLAKSLRSDILNNKAVNGADMAELSRDLSNIKSDMIRDKKLEEVCE